MTEIVISEFMDAAAVARLSARHTVVHDPRLARDRDRLQAALRPARALIVRNATRVDAALIAGAPRLDAVGRLGVGLDNIDTAACAERGIAIYPATGANDRSVAEYVIAALLILARGAFAATPAVIAGDWPRESLIGRELAGRSLGLVGYGAIARAVAVRARALEMAVLAHDPHLEAGDPAWQGVERVGLEALLARADAVSLHLPLTPETRGLIGPAQLDRMRPGALVINTARGGILDEAALAERLVDGRIGGAALDVFAEEPLSAAAGARFAGVANLILTPHIAGVTAESNARVGAVVAARILAHLEDAA